jgi:predicted dithiol-disulfide oxidoreductase (DUF899 family)
MTKVTFGNHSRAPAAKLEAFKKRMKWTFRWVSSYCNDFNYDYHVTMDPNKGDSTLNYKKVALSGEMPGLSVFYRRNDLILHSYSTHLRGLDILLPMYHLLDVTPKGRQEESGNSMAAGDPSWIRYHDSY